MRLEKTEISCKKETEISEQLRNSYPIEFFVSESQQLEQFSSEYEPKGTP